MSLMRNFAFTLVLSPLPLPKAKDTCPDCDKKRMNREIYLKEIELRASKFGISPKSARKFYREVLKIPVPSIGTGKHRNLLQAEADFFVNDDPKKCVSDLFKEAEGEQ